VYRGKPNQQHEDLNQRQLEQNEANPETAKIDDEGFLVRPGFAARLGKEHRDQNERDSKEQPGDPGNDQVQPIQRDASPNIVVKVISNRRVHETARVGLEMGNAPANHVEIRPIVGHRTGVINHARVQFLRKFAGEEASVEKAGVTMPGIDDHVDRLDSPGQTVLLMQQGVKLVVRPGRHLDQQGRQVVAAPSCTFENDHVILEIRLITHPLPSQRGCRDLPWKKMMVDVQDSVFLEVSEILLIGLGGLEIDCAHRASRGGE
jgi:hypothetical protein